MPRKDFRKHLEQASQGLLPSYIHSLGEGEDDGTLMFVFDSPKLDRDVIIQAQVSDVADYPRAHSFFVFVVSDDAPHRIGKALADIGSVEDLTVENLVKFIANKLNGCLAVSQNEEDIEMLEASGAEDWDELQDPPEDDEDDDGGGGFSDEDDGAFDAIPSLAQQKSYSNSAKANRSLVDMTGSQIEAFKDRVRADLREVKKAGFRFAHQGLLLTPGESCYVMVSCRVAKLGIPEDAMKAWHLKREEYIMLLLHYPNGYKTSEQITSRGRSDRSIVNMHVAVTKQYKIGLDVLLQAFTKVESKKEAITEPTSDEQAARMPIRPLFIGAALDDLLNGRLAALTNYRQGLHLSWNGAERFYNDHQGKSSENVQAIDTRPYQDMDFAPGEQLPRLVTSDHLKSKNIDFSFPLLAMQFALRHIVRCTDFCLVCWNKTGDEFDALKPYVCSNPLCLFQYLTLGFGPSIEFEILTQPNVVDLLVSFCYVSARACKLKDLPVGLGITVPHPQLLGKPVVAANDMYTGFPRPPSLGYQDDTSLEESKKGKQPPSKVIRAKWNQLTNEFVFDDSETKPVKAGDWICFWGQDGQKRHCKITEAWYPKIRHDTFIEAKVAKVEEEKDNIPDSLRQFGAPGTVTSNATTIPPYKPNVPPTSWTPPNADTPSKTELPEVSIAVYDCLFDDLSRVDKHSALILLLDTLPRVEEMRDYLQNKRKQGSLHAWTDAITPTALNILRWIIASNRSCIVQPETKNSAQRDLDEEQVYCMEGYVPFRFASGSPDKEAKFIKCMRETSKRLDSKYSTIFAWHGSPLENWHGIVREGLNFDRVSHGRAYGNGVYHSLDLNTSLGYSTMYQSYRPDAKSSYWPSSSLQISAAISLNEIVNAPKEFVSRSPHLVIDKTDWIQNRYLFVKCRVGHSQPPMPSRVLEQDPAMLPRGSNHNPLVLPINAISKSRQPASKSLKLGANGSKRSRVSVDGAASEDMDLPLSDQSDEEDLKILTPTVTVTNSGPPSSLKNTVKGLLSKAMGKEQKTSFKPGSLDRRTLPLLAPPSYATTQATKALQREIKLMLKTQATTPQEELGWYFDAESIENPYQLIVEMHSFDTSLPLAKDMIKEKIDSVVFELRFGPNFPFSPPFIRVIRPRFLPFLSGGGGHVTAGGAICMELLTNSGWNPSTVLEAVLLQVRMAITSTDPKPAKLEYHNAKSDYSVGEAIDAYRRACQTHGVSFSRELLQILEHANSHFSGKFQQTSKLWLKQVPLRLEVLAMICSVLLHTVPLLLHHLATNLSVMGFSSFRQGLLDSSYGCYTCGLTQTSTRYYHAFIDLQLCDDLLLKALEEA